jgi:UDP-N-acetylmuramoyl-L-alanyl-D-glutamate--2,6-diaminopimelate ligase
MMQLKDILKGVAVVRIEGDEATAVRAIQQDSRKVSDGDCFVAVKGTTTDGHQYIQQVIDKGATIVVCEKLPEARNEAVTYVVVKNAAIALGEMAANYFGNPADKVKLVGVTGTNGKTSVATLLYRLFSKLGYKVGLLSTVENKIGEETIPSTHTTPDAISLNQLLKRMVDEGCTYVFMEVSSHAVDQHRIAGLTFDGALFTNITHDHLDYHKTFENYIKAKKGFFDTLNKDTFALVNADDRNGLVMLQNTAAKRYTYSLKSASDFKCKIVENSVYGLQLDIDGTDFHSLLIGEFNAYNLTLVYGAAILLGVEKLECLTVLSELMPPEGRFQQVISPKNKIVAIVDYAHTPDALKNVLHTIRAIKTDNQKLITVVGCGGDRDKAKRPVMAQVAAKFSDKCVLTSDNPRSEEPQQIIDDMLEVFKVEAVEDKRKVLCILDRKEAIRSAVLFANPSDILLIAGKGHEKYQEIKGVKYDFDDRKVVEEIFKETEN